MWELEVDGAGSQHDEGEGGVGSVEAVGASDDQPDLCVESFDATVRDTVLDGVEDQVTALTHRGSGFDERREAGSLSARTPGVEAF